MHIHSSVPINTGFLRMLRYVRGMALHFRLLSCCRSLCHIAFRVVSWLPVVFVSVIIIWGYYVYVYIMNISGTFQKGPKALSILLSVFFLFVSHIILTLQLTSYIRTIYTKHKKIPSQFHLTDEHIQRMDESVDCRALLRELAADLPVHTVSRNGSILYCDKCESIKPDRCHHCSACDQCILKMDHHCLWVNNCVGYSNYKFFVLFLFYTVLLCVWFCLSGAYNFIQAWDKLTQLKHLVVSYTPSTLHEATKAKMAEKLAELFGGQVKKLVYACLLTCPWLAQSQTEVSAQAKNNLLYVVFVATDEQFFSLATPHERELCETVDEGGFFATEVHHFCAQLQRGNVRATEALCSPPESLILCSQQWFAITGLLDPVSLLQKSFVERCLGQATGGLVRKKKVNGRLVLRDDASLIKFCDAFRLLSYADCALRREPISPWPAPEEEGDTTRDDAEKKRILKLLHEGFEEGVVQKEALLECVVQWKARVEEEEKGEEGRGEGREEGRVVELPKRGPNWTRDLEHWLSSLRLDGLELSGKSALSPSDHDKLTQFLVAMGVTSVNPQDVLVVAEAGSHMYGLATPTSDTDYIIVFRETTENMISSYVTPKESLDNCGQKQEVEMAAYEARMFSEMLLKGAVNIVELVFSDVTELFYASEEWKTLIASREFFMSEQVILQYIGFIGTHMSIIRKGKHSGKPREGKVFYQIFHKLLSLEQFVAGLPPVIRCSGQDRDFIMRIRTGPLEGDLAPEPLLSQAQARLDSLCDKLRHRTVRLREYGDYRILQTWLLDVRGVGLKKPLRLATPPPATTRET